jgi:hypothetical protein
MCLYVRHLACLSELHSSGHECHMKNMLKWRTVLLEKLNHSAVEETHCLMWKLKVCCCNYKNPSLKSEFEVHSFQFCLTEMLILPSHLYLDLQRRHLNLYFLMTNFVYSFISSVYGSAQIIIHNLITLIIFYENCNDAVWLIMFVETVFLA